MYEVAYSYIAGVDRIWELVSRNSRPITNVRPMRNAIYYIQIEPNIPMKVNKLLFISNRRAIKSTKSNLSSMSAETLHKSIKRHWHGRERETERKLVLTESTRNASLATIKINYLINFYIVTTTTTAMAMTTATIAISIFVHKRDFIIFAASPERVGCATRNMII